MFITINTFQPSLVSSLTVIPLLAEMCAIVSASCFEHVQGVCCWFFGLNLPTLFKGLLNVFEEWYVADR